MGITYYLKSWFSICCLVFLTGSLSHATESGQAQLDQLLEKIQQRVSNTKTVQCEFEQERNLSIFAQPILFSGKMALVRPGKLRWENIDPIPSAMIFAGEKGLRCNDDAEPVHFKLEKDPVMKMVADQIWTWVDGDYAKLQNKYAISLVEDFAIRMTPSTGEFANIITSVTVKFDQQSLQPHTIHIQEAEGDSTIIRFSDYRINEPVPEELFTTCYP